MSSPHEEGEHSPELEVVIQKLEESILDVEGRSGETETIPGHEPGSGAISAPVSRLIRRIITRNLAGDSCEAANMEDYQRESSSQTQTDDNEPPDQQCSLTEKLNQMLMLPSPADSDQDSVSPWQPSSQERVSRHVFQEAQQRQAQLVQRLQTKVIQYKSRCGELEGQVLEKTSNLEKMRLLMLAQQDLAQRDEQNLNATICSKAAQLDEGQRRCARLSHVNSVLREQLEQAGTVNQALAETWREARQDAAQSEARLCKEQESPPPTSQTASSRPSRQQARVRALWRQAASLRSTFTQLRGFADRTLADMRGECAAASQQLHAVCQNLQSRGTQESASSGTEAWTLERQLKTKLREAMQLQGRWDAEKVVLNSRVVELADAVEHLCSLNSEKDAALTSLQSSLDTMETRRTEDRAAMETLRAENRALQNMICNVHKLVAGEVECAASEGRSPPPNTTLMAVQSALSKHQKQTQHLGGRLDAASEEVDALRGQLQRSDCARRELETRMQEVMEESQEALKECLRERDSARSSLEVISSEKCGVEQRLLGVQQEADSLRGELEALRGMSSDLQRQRDLLQQQREDAELQLTRQRTEAQRGERSLEELEGKHSDLRRELVTVKEALSGVTLEKEVLLEDKASLALALSKMECHSAAQESGVTKLQNQEADLKDSLAKMAALSEGLAKDKVELSRLLLQAEAEKAQLSDGRRQAEADRASSRDEASRLQREKMNLLLEKKALESSHRHLQALRHKLEEDLDLLQREKARILEQHSQVSRQMQSVSEELHHCRKQLEVHHAALKKAGADKEELAKDKAGLEVRLSAAERTTFGLVQELQVLRAEKQSLETSLFQSHELSSSLEAECGRLEAERRSMLSANEALTRDVAQVRLDAEHQLAQAAQERSALEEKWVQVERNALQSLKSRDEQHREQLEAQRRLKEQQCAALTEQLRAGSEASDARSRKEAQQAQEEAQQAQKELLRVQQQCKQILLQAESEKQEALSQKAAMVQEMSGLQQNLDSATTELQRARSDALAAQEQNKKEVSALRCETDKLRTEFQASVNSHEVAERGRCQQVRELGQQNQVAQQELEGLRVQLQDAQDGLGRGQKELLEARRALRDCAQGQEKQRKEALNLRRLLDDETREKEAIRASNQELRASVKRVESDNSSLRRAVEEKEQKASILEEHKRSMHEEVSTLRSSMRELEKSRLQARRGLQDLRRQVKALEGEKSRQKQELQNMQARLCQQEQKEEEARHQSCSLKQTVSECQTARGAAHSQVSALQRRVTELEERERHSRELLQATEAEQQVRDQKHQEVTVRLQRALEDAAMQSGQLSARLEHAQAAVQTLEHQLGECEHQRRDLDHKLSTLRSALRRTVGMDAGARSPRRKHLPGHRPTPAEEQELDLDCVQAGLLELQREVRDAQREKIHSLLLEEQVHKLSTTLGEHRGSEAKLQEQIGQLQRALTASEHDRRLLQDRLDKTRDALSESKTLNHSLTERAQTLQRAHEDSELRNSALEEHKQTLHQSLKRRQEEAEATARESADQLESKVEHLQGSLHKMQQEKADVEKVLVRLGKDKSALRKTLEKAQADSLRTQEAESLRTEQAGQVQAGMERQLAERQDQVTALQAHISQLEHTHTQRLLEVTVRHHQELDAETACLRGAQLQAEQALQSRERAHRQRVKCLEDQVSTLKEQLDQEAPRRRRAHVKQMLRPAVHSSM
ncbi:rootletin-like isoform X1 [Entelurus aequoreus]|uniref:rootletin-like isoform X1 n=1 Tax=Entelurus aequoreus TaxID=161455 RepID=UPI002B1DDB37|nr:rootletin-like isoform X1 [Entelurus aequoreus]